MSDETVHLMPLADIDGTSDGLTRCCGRDYRGLVLTPDEKYATCGSAARAADDLAGMRSIAMRLRDEWHVVSTTTVDGIKHEWWRAVWDADDEREPMSPAEWTAFQSLPERPTQKETR